MQVMNNNGVVDKEEKGGLTLEQFTDIVLAQVGYSDIVLAQVRTFGEKKIKSTKDNT